MSQERRFTDPHYAVDAEYRRQLEDSEARGQCIFCDPRFKGDAAKVLRRSSRWYVRANDYPTRDVDGNAPALHLLFIAEEHTESLDPDAWVDIHNVMTWAVEAFGIKGGGLACRFGDYRWSGGTIFHPHLHLIVPNTGPDPGKEGNVRARPIYFPIG